MPSRPRPAFVLTLNQVARVDIAMKVGQATETVEVTAEAPIMKTESTQVDTIINAATNDNLPLASRNYVQLTLLAPGAVSTDPSSFNNGNNTGGYGGRPLINGNREQANNFLLDGMDNNQVSDNLLGYTPAPDAIQEFNLITNNASGRVRQLRRRHRQCHHQVRDERVSRRCLGVLPQRCSERKQLVE